MCPVGLMSWICLTIVGRCCVYFLMVCLNSSQSTDSCVFSVHLNLVLTYSLSLGTCAASCTRRLMLPVTDCPWMTSWHGVHGNGVTVGTGIG